MPRNTAAVCAAICALLFNTMTPYAEDTPALSADFLQFSTYVIADSVKEIAASPDQAAELLRASGIGKVYLEFYRGGLVTNETDLVNARDGLKTRGFSVVGGIATVPGANFGVRETGPLAWFNYQDEKTRRDLEQVMRLGARVFDTIIVDDFLCTGDRSAASASAKGERSWSDYRRDLMVDIAQHAIIAPAREVRPDITLIVKFPQWYDRFHLHGYDVQRMPALFDQVWVGTETRGARTQRYGFVQPYEGFVNYRWLASLAGEKLRGAWFDHGDCNAQDFLDQAYQSVLAGAREIVLFNYADLAAGHPGHGLLQEHRPRLESLAKSVTTQPISAIYCYKPPQSDAHGDMYLMDYLGMLGLPLVPVSSFPEHADVLILPTQAVTDRRIYELTDAFLAKPGILVLTTGFLAHCTTPEAWCNLAGVASPVTAAPVQAKRILVDDTTARVPGGLDLGAALEPAGAEVLLEALVHGKRVPFLTCMPRGNASVYVLNVHTFTQADFDRVGEVLLAPRDLGLLNLPQPWVDSLRSALAKPLGVELRAPARVTLQPVTPGAWFIQNYNDFNADIEFLLPTGTIQVRDAFRTVIRSSGDAESPRVCLKASIEPGGNLWIESVSR